MNQSIKSVIALLILVALIVNVVAWLSRATSDTRTVIWSLRALPLVWVPLLALLIWADFRKDKLPNFLLRYAKGYFESNGLSFTMFPTVVGQTCTWLMLFQNRYERPCQTAISFRPGVGHLGIRRAKMNEVSVEFDCEGAAFGVIRVPYSVPADYQGKKVRFEVAAVTRYPEGHGQMLRYREGTNVSKHHKWGGDVAVMAVSGLAGHLHYHKASSFAVRMPINVAEHADGPPVVEILWLPGDPDSVNLGI